MPATLNEIIELLDIEQLEVNLFRGAQPAETKLVRVFGGQVAGQAIMAAMRTVPADRHLHSMHVYFILGGDPSIPIIYDVEAVRDGRSFTTRRVSARQHGEVIFYMTASFQIAEDGLDHQEAMPAVPSPDDSMPLEDVMRAVAPDAVELFKAEWGGFQTRYVGDNRSSDDPSRSFVKTVQRMWFRADGRLPDDQNLHRAAFTYYSDYSLLGASLLPHGIMLSSPRIQAASLDHVIWFHRPFRVDEWLLYDQTSPSASGARGLSTAKIFREDGSLVATLAQEGLIRPVRPRD